MTSYGTRLGWGGATFAALLVAITACNSDEGTTGTSSSGIGGALGTSITVASGTGGTGGTLTVEQGCQAYVDSVCDRLEACWPSSVAEIYGDLETCKQREGLVCAFEQDLGGSQRTGADFAACGSVYATMPCLTILEHREPPCTIPQGTLADGTACGKNHQCASGLCSATATACGTCQPKLPGLGEDCTTGCNHETLICTGGKCALRGGVGDPCDAQKPCLPSIACIGGACKAPAQDTQACDPTLTSAPDCERPQGLLCLGGTCYPGTLVPPGTACDQKNICTHGSKCEPSVPGTCEKAPPDGEACDPAKGPNCLAPASCDAASKCAILDPRTCK